MRILSAVLAATVGSGPNPDRGVGEADDRPYRGPTSLSPEAGSPSEQSPRWRNPHGSTEDGPKHLPSTDGDSLFVDPTSPLTHERGPGLERQRPPTPLEADPLQLLAADERADGHNLLLTAGIFGALASLAGLAVTQVASSHVSCLGDLSRLKLVPCAEQVGAHRGAYLLSSSLFVGGLPFLATGSVAHGRRLERERLRPRLTTARARQRTANAALTTAVGVVLLGASGGLVAQVLAGGCRTGCGAKSVSSQIAWWLGAAATALGVNILGYTHGRTHPAKPRRLRLSPGPLHKGASLGLSGRF